jgi:hypothetical protein
MAESSLSRLLVERLLCSDLAVSRANFERRFCNIEQPAIAANRSSVAGHKWTIKDQVEARLLSDGRCAYSLFENPIKGK